MHPRVHDERGKGESEGGRRSAKEWLGSADIVLGSEYIFNAARYHTGRVVLHAVGSLVGPPYASVHRTVGPGVAAAYLWTVELRLHSNYSLSRFFTLQHSESYSTVAEYSGEWPILTSVERLESIPVRATRPNREWAT